MGRITLDGGIAQFSTGLETAPNLWDVKAGESTGKSLHELKVNRELKDLSKAIETHYAQIVEKDGYVTAERIKNAVLGIAKEPTTLLKELEEATAEIEKVSVSIIVLPHTNLMSTLTKTYPASLKRNLAKKIFRLTSWNIRL